MTEEELLVAFDVIEEGNSRHMPWALMKLSQLNQLIPIVYHWFSSFWSRSNSSIKSWSGSNSRSKGKPVEMSRSRSKDDCWPWVKALSWSQTRDGSKSKSLFGTQFWSRSRLKYRSKTKCLYMES